MKTLTPELRHLVSRSVALLGRVIERELGPKLFQHIEDLRQQMADLRDLDEEKSFLRLQEVYKRLDRCSQSDQHSIAHSFTLMLELMNACENAYRSHRLNVHQEPPNIGKARPSAIVYVLTAHPTEARSPLNIAIFHQIQTVLMSYLKNSQSDIAREFLASEENDLIHLMEIAWRTSIVRNRSPKVKDEAEHIYTMLFREEILMTLLDFSDRHCPVYIRSWVGGDKDGHPGVDEKVLLQSLNLSRQKIVKLLLAQMKEIRGTLETLSAKAFLKKITAIEKQIRSLRTIQRGDAKKVQLCRESLLEFRNDYVKFLGAVHPRLRRVRQIFHIFPGLVVPLELRESSDVLMAPPEKKKIAIERMLATVANISAGGEPRWYTRGFIISMCESIEHIRAAAAKQMTAFGELRLPIIPLFEEAGSLVKSPQVMLEMTHDKKIKAACEKYWDGLLEMMVGYSDSAKEAGVLQSRLAIAESLPKLEKVAEKAHLTPLFFHGSGGSIDRGGGSIEDQTAWWPKSALRRYKGTIQGEMVERNLATPEIADRQLEQIYESTSHGLDKNHRFTKDPVLDLFAAKIAERYRAQIKSAQFLGMVEAATPYSYLNVLKIGSRPAKRAKQLQVSGLRAIPWVLCWTQTRVLFPTWWGIGSAWKELTVSQKASLKKSFKTDAVFTSYVRALGFTLAKIQVDIFRMYLEKSSLSSEQKQQCYQEFADEIKRTKACFKELTGQKDYLWYKPWLAESIYLRAPMIHPLNLLQIIAKRDKDNALLRVTVTGISSGMLTTG
jgi:Phosphoenolpyruvate carboxylase